jgi:hypothetical protein
MPALMLRFGSAVGGEVVGGEAAVAEEAGPHRRPHQRGLQPRGVRRRQLEAFDQELPGFLGAYLGRLFDVWVHEFGELCGVDRVLVDRIELGQDAAQDRP